MNLLQGSLVKATAGHNIGQFFVVVKVEGNFVYICDGKERQLSNPKKKNIKHIAKTCEVISLEQLTNKKLKKLLNEYNKNV